MIRLADRHRIDETRGGSIIDSSIEDSAERSVDGFDPPRPRAPTSFPRPHDFSATPRFAVPSISNNQNEPNADGSVATDDPIGRRFMIRFAIGIAILVGLAIPAKIHSDVAIKSLYNRPAEWVPDSVPVKEDYNRFSEQFDVRDVILVGWPGSKLDSEPLANAAAMLEGLSNPEFDELSTALRQKRVDELKSIHPWIDQFYTEARELTQMQYPLRWARSGTETLEALTSRPASMSRAAAVRRLQGTLVGPDGEQSCLVMALEFQADHFRREFVPMIQQNLSRLLNVPEEELAFVGGPYDGAVIDTAAIDTVARFSPPSSIIAALLCLLCLRSIALTAVIVATAVIGQGLVLAMVYYAGYDMNAVLIVLPPLVFVLTVSAGIHLSNYFLDIIREFPDKLKSEAAASAMRAGVMPCVLATGTTVVGLLSLLLVRLEPVRLFGAVASIGVTLTLALLILVLPGAMLLTKVRHRKPVDAPESTGNRVHQFIRRRLARPWPTIIVFATLSITMAFGLPRLQSGVNVSRMFEPESQLRRNYEWFESNVGATATGDLVLSYPRDDQSDALERLRHTTMIQKAVLDLPGVGGTLSAATFVPSIPKTRRISAAATRNVIRGLLEDPESSIGRLNYITRDDEGDHWRITVRIPQSADINFKPRIDSIIDAARATAAEMEVPPIIRFTGHVVITEESQQILLSDLFSSFITAFAVIAVVMMATLRSVVGGLLAMLPNLFPTVVLFGLMGWINEPLDIGSVMSASVALGIAVDDTVHLLSRFGSRRARGIGQIRAAHGALSQCGWAMLQTTLVCGLALMSYYFSEFVPTSRFALFMFALLVTAVSGVLLLLPSMMASSLGQFLARGVGADPNAAIYRENSASDPPMDVRRV